MSATSDISERALAALRDLADAAHLATHTTKNGAHCMATPVGNLCVLAVPNRSEIEVWLEVADGPSHAHFDGALLASVVGKEPAAIMFTKENPNAAIGKLSIFLSEILSALRTDPKQFLSTAQEKYRNMVRASLDRGMRIEANELWSAGRHSDAAKLYESLAELTPVERKRVELARGGRE